MIRIGHAALSQWLWWIYNSKQNQTYQKQHFFCFVRVFFSFSFGLCASTPVSIWPDPERLPAFLDLIQPSPRWPSSRPLPFQAHVLNCTSTPSNSGSRLPPFAVAQPQSEWGFGTIYKQSLVAADVGLKRIADVTMTRLLQLLQENVFVIWCFKNKTELTESNYNHFIDTNTESRFSSTQLSAMKLQIFQLRVFKLRDHLQKHVQDCL